MLEAVGRFRRDLVRWQCDCGNKGVAPLSFVEKNTDCGQCVPRKAVTPGRGGIYRSGDEVGCWRILERTDKRTTDRCGKRRLLYDAQCMRCGNRQLRSARHLTPPRQRCGACKYKYDVCGKLLTYDEIDEGFGVKRSLLMHRMGRLGMSLEEAIFLGTDDRYNPNKPPSNVKRCTRCHEDQPLEAFNRDNSVKTGRGPMCKPCRSAYRRERRQRKAS